MSSKSEHFRKLLQLFVNDFRSVTPSPDPEAVVPFMTKIVWTLAFLLFAYVTAGTLVIK